MKSFISRRSNTIFAVILITLITLFFFLRGNYSVVPGFSDGVFSIDGPEGISYRCRFEEIKSIDFLKEFDFGSCISGGSKFGFKYGEFQNDDIGKYQLAVSDKNSSYIKVDDIYGNCVVFNLENEETTEQLAAAMKSAIFSE